MRLRFLCGFLDHYTISLDTDMPEVCSKLSGKLPAICTEPSSPRRIFPAFTSLQKDKATISGSHSIFPSTNKTTLKGYYFVYFVSCISRLPMQIQKGLNTRSNCRRQTLSGILSTMHRVGGNQKPYQKVPSKTHVLWFVPEAS